MAHTPSVLVVYYSRTGTTATVAQTIVDELNAPDVERIHPRTERRYLNWLARSFVPGSTVPIEPVEAEPREYDAVFLGTPKWTLSCPPVTAYLEQVRFDDTTVGVFLTFGGFDEERYASRLEARLAGEGARSVDSLLLKRDRVEAGPSEQAVEAFVRQVLDRAEADR